MQRIKKPTPLWLTIIITVILVVTASFLIAPYMPSEITKLSKLNERLYSTWVKWGADWLFIQDNTVPVYGDYEKYEPPQIGVGGGEQTIGPPVTSANVTLIEGIYHLYFSIHLDGPYLSGLYEIECRFQTDEFQTSQVFNLTITEYDRLPKVATLDWRTNVRESSSYSYEIALSKGWSRGAVSFNAFAFYLAAFYPEVAVAILILVGILVGFPIYHFAKRRGKPRRSQHLKYNRSS